MNRHFSKEYIQKANIHMKRYAPLLVIRENKSIIRYYLMTVRTARIKETGDNKC